MIELRAQRWPFVESPGDFTERLAKVSNGPGGLLAGVRTVLIEEPPALSRNYFAALPAEPGTMEGALTAMLKEALDKLAAHRHALQKIADLIDSEAGEPLDDAIDIATNALQAT